MGDDDAVESCTAVVLPHLFASLWGVVVMVVVMREGLWGLASIAICSRQGGGGGLVLSVVAGVPSCSCRFFEDPSLDG